MTAFSKTLKPGQKPKPSFQGYESTCSIHALGKALTAGLQYGKFGTTLDISQNEAISSIINKRKIVDACWPDELDQETIISYDRNTNLLFNIELRVAECDFKQLERNWTNATYVAVYKNTQGPHSIYVNKIHGGKLCCMNSYGRKDQFPQLRQDEVIALYELTANVTKAPKKCQPSPPTGRKSNKLSNQTTLSNQTSLDAEKAKLEQERDQLKQENEKLKQERERHKATLYSLEVLDKVNKQNEILEKDEKFVGARAWFRKGKDFISTTATKLKNKIRH